MSFSSPMTREKMESLGHHTRGTYRGPLGWEYATGLCKDLGQAKREDGTPTFTPGSLCIVSQDDGYNVVYILTEQKYQRDQARRERHVKEYMRGKIEYLLWSGKGEITPALLAKDACSCHDLDPDDVPEDYLNWASEITQEYKSAQ